jgi:hypothetical protein
MSCRSGFSYVSIFLLVLCMAFLFVRCDCGDTDEDKIEGYEDAHDDIFDDGNENLNEVCEDSIAWLRDTCEMEWESGTETIHLRCPLGDFDAWKACIKSAVDEAVDCDEAIDDAEKCEALVV